MKKLKDLNIEQLLFFELPSLLKEQDELNDNQVNDLHASYMGHKVTNYDRYPSKRDQLENLKLLEDFKFINIPNYLLNSFKEALFLFVNNFYTGTVANSGIICEYLAKYVITFNELSLEIRESQYQRLQFIKQNSFLDLSIIKKFLRINQIRNDFVHFGNSDEYDREILKSKSLIALNDLIDILNYFSQNFFFNPKPKS